MTMPDLVNAQGWILCAEHVQTRQAREFRTTEMLTRSDAWLEAREEGRYARSAPWVGPVTDNVTGDRFWARPAPCGAGCYCAAEYRTTPPKETR